MKFSSFFLIASLAFVSPIHAFSVLSNSQSPKAPLEIKAQNGMVCSQDKKRCTALGPVTSTRGTSVLKSSKLIVYFKSSDATQKENTGASPQQDIKRIKALGNVHFFDTQGGVQATGNYALYNAEKGQLSLQGHPVLRDAKTTVLGGTEVIFYEKTQRAKTIGRSTVKRDDKLMQADVFHVHFTKDAAGKLTFDRVEAQGNVVISTPTEIAKAKRGVYANNTQVAELFDDVVITRAEGQLRGDYGRYDMASGQSQLFNEKGVHDPTKQVQAILSPQALKRTKEKKKTK